jgi:hypothetical protein
VRHVHHIARLSRWARAHRLVVVTLVAMLLSACGSVTLVATSNIPTPLITKIPVTVALYLPEEFSSYTHKEERWNTDWNIHLGQAQTEGLTRLINAMFERVVVVDSINAGSQVGDVRAILEPSVEEYAFVTPRDAGTPFFAVSIKYRVNVYSPDGRLADSWGFTGYGTSPAQGMSSTAPLTQATALALRDAGAKLAVEFREQAIVRGLLPDAETEAAPTAAPAEESSPPGNEPAETPPETEAPGSVPAAPAPEEPTPSGDPVREEKPVSLSGTRSFADG